MSDVPYKVLGQCFGRGKFFLRYLAALASSRRIERLMPIVQQVFHHDWVQGMRIEFLVQYGFTKEPGRCISWDAPVALTIHGTKRGKKKPALGMSLYVQGSTLYIQQLQGVAGIFIPLDLQDWPIRFIEACKVFARQEGYKAVMLPRAETLHSYRRPTVKSSTDVPPQKLLQLRESMRLRYDVTALQLGFVPAKNWFVWKNNQLC